MFHRVVPDEPTAFGLPSSYRLRGTALTPAELEHELDAAPAVVPLGAVENALLAGVAPPPGVVLTFDDGYREHLDVVVPLLRARGMSATFYLMTDIHGGGRQVAVVDAWYWTLDHAQRPELRVRLPGGNAFVARCDTREAKLAWVVGSAKRALLGASAADQAAMLRELAASAECELPADLAAQLYLAPGDWQRLADSGMRVGAHSLTHPRLTLLPDDALHREVSESIAVLSPLGQPATFAYPDGAFDDRVAAKVAAHAISAVTCEVGTVSGGQDRLRLPRRFVAGFA
ncbi:MAG: polysaccharide deacetylase family protein [Sandaracinaceae bacterium]|nr:polysaccharide deacetylase family protein [Sandaracinaceae bacterium]